MITYGFLREIVVVSVKFVCNNICFGIGMRVTLLNLYRRQNIDSKVIAIIIQLRGD